MNLLTIAFIFFKELFRSRRVVKDLTKRDFKTKYLGSHLGLLWAFIHPSITILIFWFVFQVGFKSTPVDNFPFILWIMAGMIPWFFFSESLSNATYSIIENSFLVKKVIFRVSILPIIKILSALFIHLFFIGVLFVMFAVYGYVPNIYNLQVLYYLFATIVFLMGLSWITSSLVIFLKDIGQMVNMVLQFGFWLTPIFWSIKILPEKYQFIMKLNPIFYLIEGYRNSFIYKVWFWEHYILTLYFWSVTLVIIILGTVLFRKLRPHFADVL